MYPRCHSWSFWQFWSGPNGGELVFLTFLTNSETGGVTVTAVSGNVTSVIERVSAGLGTLLLPAGVCTLDCW